MGLKDLKLFPMEQILVTKIQGRTNKRHYSKQFLKYFPHMPLPPSPFTLPNTTYSTTPNTVAFPITAPQTTYSP